MVSRVVSLSSEWVCRLVSLTNAVIQSQKVFFVFPFSFGTVNTTTNVHKLKLHSQRSHLLTTYYKQITRCITKISPTLSTAIFSNIATN